MFYDCNSLVEFIEYTNFEINKNKIKDKQDEKKEYLDSKIINKDNNFCQHVIDERTIKAKKTRRKPGSGGRKIIILSESSCLSSALQGSVLWQPSCIYGRKNRFRNNPILHFNNCFSIHYFSEECPHLHSFSECLKLPSVILSVIEGCFA